jgi:hypothetical protein
MPSRIAMPIGLDPPVKGPETPTRMGSMAEAALATRIIDAKTILSRRPGKGVSLFFVMVACQRRGGTGESVCRLSMTHWHRLATRAVFEARGPAPGSGRPYRLGV